MAPREGVAVGPDPTGLPAVEVHPVLGGIGCRVGVGGGGDTPVLDADADVDALAVVVDLGPHLVADLVGGHLFLPCRPTDLSLDWEAGVSFLCVVGVGWVNRSRATHPPGCLSRSRLRRLL